MSKKSRNGPCVRSVVVFRPSSCNVAQPQTPAEADMEAWVGAAATAVVPVGDRAVRSVLHSSYGRDNKVIDDKHQFYFSLITIDVIWHQIHLVNWLTFAIMHVRYFLTVYFVKQMHNKTFFTGKLSSRILFIEATYIYLYLLWLIVSTLITFHSTPKSINKMCVQFTISYRMHTNASLFF